MLEKQQKNILRVFILQPTKKIRFWWLSRIVPCTGAAVTAEAVVFRDNAVLSPDTGFSAVIFRAVGQTFWSQYAYVTSKVLGIKQPKGTFSGPTKRCLFLPGTPFFFFFPPFSGCSVPDSCNHHLKIRMVVGRLGLTWAIVPAVFQTWLCQSDLSCQHLQSLLLRTIRSKNK